MDRAVKDTVISENRLSDNDTGSTQVQVAILTSRINRLTEHLSVQIHDEPTRRGLLKLVGRRRRLLDYLNRNDSQGYRDLLVKLELRR